MRMPVSPGRRHEELGERAPVARSVDEPVALGGALGEVGRLRQPELGARAVESRSCRCTARAARRRASTRSESCGLDPRRATRGTGRAPARRVRRPRGRRSRAGRSSPRPIAGGAREAAVADRRHPRAQALVRARRSRSRPCRRSRAPPCAGCACRSTATNGSPSPNPAYTAYSMCECALTKPGVITQPSKCSPCPRSAAAPTAAIVPSSAIATAPVGDRRALDGNDPVRRDDSHGSVALGRQRPCSALVRPSRIDEVAAPAWLHHLGQPDRGLEEDQERDRLEQERDGVDRRQQDREDDHQDVARSCGCGAACRS